MLRRERALIKRGVWPVAGCDEAGRGPLAGPVVAAAVVLDPKRIPKGIDDSKRLTAARFAQALCVPQFTLAGKSRRSGPSKCLPFKKKREPIRASFVRLLPAVHSPPASPRIPLVLLS